MSCPGICSVEGGSHISTYDKKHYDVYGDCTYVLSKHCEDERFTILVELRKCGMTNTETCLKTVTLSLNKGQMLIEVKADGGVFVNSIYTQLPISAANVTIFRPSSFFVIMHTNVGIQVEIQFTPIMQMFVRLDPMFKDQTCGLCGNFNNVQTDDFKAISGVVEGTAAAFANTWKTQASCPDIQNSFENPCALSIDNEKYAQHWCGLLTNKEGPFADCHYLLNPSTYHTNCMFDTCNCQNSEGCLCAALSSYVRACAARGIQINGWRTNVCSKYTTSCPKSLSYSYTIDSCQPTCRSLSEPDVTCKIKFVPVDGCTCINGTYMDESGKCVPANECPCYYRGSPIPLGEVVHENGLVCTCIQGKLNCIGEPNQIPVCESPMFYLDCRNNTAEITGSECQKSCQTLDMQCYSTQCVSGCVCPSGLVLDGKGGCIPEEECPCIHNGAMYQPGEKINADCNTCVCKDRMWECTKKQCLGTCAVYGDGHYTTFDDQRFSFSGNCEYTLVQNHCGKSDTANGTFQVITENIPCGSTGTTCSKSIKVFLEHYELILSEERVSVIKRGRGGEVPFTVRYIGMYTVIDTTSGLILMWDKKTSIFIKLSPEFKGQICGLCGNYDGNGINDFTTRSLSVVENVLEFGNSWKVSSTCPDANFVKDPCSTNPYRKSWSEKQCSIINSNVFAACHSQVEPAKYYQACVTDACACDSGGDCDCFCTAVAAYAQACNEVGVCIAWRTPSICPLFCDYYNQQGECEWHYKPCGASCMKTCKNPSGKCLHNLPGLEGCYPNCPPDKPYFHEDQMKCVSLCDCYDNEDGKIYMREKCQLCECTSEGLQCKFDDKACNCIYENNTYKYNELIYNTTDGSGWCFRATCDVNGTINRNIFECGITSTPFTFSTSQPTTEMATTTAVKTVCVKYVCEWSEWYNGTELENEEETFQNITEKSTCNEVSSIECRVHENSPRTIKDRNQKIQCNKTTELKCNNKDEEDKKCYNYQIRVLCCNYKSCSEITTTTPRQTQQTTSITTETTTIPVQTKIKPTTTQKGTKPQEKEITTISTPTSGASTTKMSVHPTTIATTSGTTTPTSSASTTKTTLPSTEGTTTMSSTSAGTTTPTSSASTTKTTPLTTGSTTTITSPTTITTSPPPSTCQPRCAWTRWFDVDSPSSGSQGGDFETYANIRAAGYDLCSQPQDIRCRAENYPDRSLESLDQKLKCSLDVGLECRNEDQNSKYPMCFNYQVSVLCCDHQHCLTTSPTPGTTTSTSTGTTSSETTSTSTTGVTTTTSPPPTGPTTVTAESTTKTVPPTPEGTTTMSSTSAETTIPASSASTTKTSPPPTKGTTTMSSTSAGTTTPTSSASTTKTTPLTTGSTTTTTSPTTTITTSPPPSTCQPRCAWTRWFDVDSPSSGSQGGDFETYANIRAAGYDLCSQPQDIRCRAENYPDRSLESLDQKLKCSLDVGLECRNEDQNSKYPMCFNYQVSVLCCDHQHCLTTSPTPGTTTSTSTGTTSSETTSTSTTGVTTTTSPPPTGPTTVTAESTTKTVPPTPEGTTTMSSTSAGTTSPTSSASTTKTSPPPTNGMTTISFTSAGTTTPTSSVSTTKTSPPPTKSTKTVASTSARTTVPTSTASTTKITAPVVVSTTTIVTTTPSVSSSPTSTVTTLSSTSAISATSPTEQTHPTAKPTTVPKSSTTTTKSTTGVTTTTSPPPTGPTTITAGSTTRSAPPPTKADTSQPSHATSTSAFSSSSPTAPSTTESRGTTLCFCHVFGDLFSPGEVVYNRTDKAGCNFYALCSNECEIAPFLGPCPTTTPLTSVSSETTTQASSSTATSLTTLLERNCTDVSPPRKPGEEWTNECQECVCDPHTATTQCRLSCQIQEAVCDVGFIALPVVPVTNLCCPELKCQRRSNTCEINGKIYENGTSVIDSCKNCTCTSEKNLLTGYNIVKCEALKCETSCPLGHQYKIEDGDCCGKCIEVSCRIHLNNETVVLEVGEILPLDLCSHYKCEIIEDQYVAVQTKRVCPEYGPLECDPDEAETTPDGCCKICKPTNCKAYSTKTVIQHEDCESSEAVELTYCEGTCPGSSMYSLKANQMQHDCTCCQELSSQRRDVILNCQNGTSINYSYVYVDQCQCINACNPQTLEADDYQFKISQRQT
ncbi:mucin-5B [Meleagris gallopavo]|uniref:mucin-5B n=1 Tax=Meleagris gallopavo TaxID=9103 RepID=UPI0012AC2FF9|nr:mucin-5B [Meleagris gallopavo]